MSDNAKNNPKIGVCYYPEHWPEQQWADHCVKMVAAGINLVRVGEFAWSRIEPTSGQFDWGWLDRALETLHQHQLKIVMCTPTACPPKWLVGQHPDMLAVDENGHKRRFGSRRHYCFSSPSYLKQAERISKIVIERYAEHPAIVGWQTDNEYGCHETTVSYSSNAVAAFRVWLENKYESIDALNQAWGNVFWSMEYNNFEQIESPLNTVTESNPSHRLDYQRFSSDQVVAFNQIQVKLIRDYCRDDVWITHNLMGNFLEFDHFDLGQDIDVPSWDSYPLGFLQQSWFDEKTKNHYRRTGHPDWAAFHHDLYRGVGQGRWGVMEQQPGAVNWASFNAQPLDGMVRYWGWEAIAHGAKFVSYFRWQQAPFAQEQMHAALNHSNGETAQAYAEVQQLSTELSPLSIGDTQQAKVALVFDYPSVWITQIQAQAADYDALALAVSYYSALRKLGLDVDIIDPRQSIEGYAMVVVPCVCTSPKSLIEQLQQYQPVTLLGPRIGSKTDDYQTPTQLAPGEWQKLMPASVETVDSIRTGHHIEIEHANDGAHVLQWLESLNSNIEPSFKTVDGRGVFYSSDNVHYLNAVTDQEFLLQRIQDLLIQAQVNTLPLPAGLRLRRRGDFHFAFNLGERAVDINDFFPELTDDDIVVGTRHIERAQVCVFKASLKTNIAINR